MVIPYTVPHRTSRELSRMMQQHTTTQIVIDIGKGHKGVITSHRLRLRVWFKVPSTFIIRHYRTNRYFTPFFALGPSCWPTLRLPLLAMNSQGVSWILFISKFWNPSYWRTQCGDTATRPIRVRFRSAEPIHHVGEIFYFFFQFWTQHSSVDDLRRIIGSTRKTGLARKIKTSTSSSTMMTCASGWYAVAVSEWGEK